MVWLLARTTLCHSAISSTIGLRFVGWIDYICIPNVCFWLTVTNLGQQTEYALLQKGGWFRNATMKIRYFALQQGNRSLLDFLNKKMTLFQRLFPGWELVQNYYEVYESFLRHLTHVALVRKIQDLSLNSLDQLRSVCLDQQSKLEERKYLGLGSVGSDPRTNFRTKLNNQNSQKVKYTITKGDEGIVCFNCNKMRHKDFLCNKW